MEFNNVQKDKAVDLRIMNNIISQVDKFKVGNEIKIF